MIPWHAFSPGTAFPRLGLPIEPPSKSVAKLNLKGLILHGNISSKTPEGRPSNGPGKKGLRVLEI